MKKLALLGILLTSTFGFAKQIPLKWKAIKGASSYKFEVANDKSFSQVIYAMGVNSNNFDYETKSGIYYLRVQAINNKGKGGKWSKPFKLVVTAPVKPFNENALNQEMNLDNSESTLPAKWIAPESKAPKYKVTLMKDGEEVEQKETSTEDFEFKTKSPGNYEIVVQAGLDKYFGPPVTVKKYKLAKINFISPRHVVASKPNFSNKGPVEIKLPETVQGKKYKLVLYKVDPRSPAGVKTPVMTKTVDSPTADFGPLPPGHYVAAVEKPNIKSDAPVSEFNFNVRKAKPVEFQKVDLTFRYSFRQFDYSNSILEAGTSAHTGSFGGDINFQGTMWFPDSDWGIRADGHFGNMLVEQSYLGINDLQLDSTYKTTSPPLGTEFVFYAGARLWTIPIVSKSTNNGVTTTDVYNPTFLGPAVGMDFIKSFGPKWSLIGNLELSQALTYTRFSEAAIFQNPDIHPNVKITLGARYALNQRMGITGSIGAQDDSLSYTPNPANIHSGTNSGSKTRLDLSSANVILGLEINDETSNFTDAPELHEKFSDLDFSIRAHGATLNYAEHLQEIINSGRNGLVAFNNSLTAGFDLETVGFFTGSNNGFRLSASWLGYSYSGVTVSYPEFVGQWAYRSNLSKKPGFQFKNYFGVRAWQFPIILSGSISNGFSSINTGLLGPDERVQLTYRLSDTWTTNLKAELSIPVIMANKPSYYDKIFPSNMSWRASMDFTKELNEDLSISLEGGYYVDQLRYTANGLSDANSSTASMSAPRAGINATYSF